MRGKVLWGEVQRQLATFGRQRLTKPLLALQPVFVVVPAFSMVSLSPLLPPGNVRMEAGLQTLVTLAIVVLLPAYLVPFSRLADSRSTAPGEKREAASAGRMPCVGTAVAAVLFSLGVAYPLFVVFLVWIRLSAAAPEASQILGAPELMAQFVTAPLVAAWCAFAALAVSDRIAGRENAVLISLVLGLPALGVAALAFFRVFGAGFGAAGLVCAMLLAMDGAGWAIAARTARFSRDIPPPGRWA